MITPTQIIDLLTNTYGVYVANPMLYDTEYSCPTADWVLGPFSKDLAKVLSDLGFTYITNSRDCDKFARFVASYCALRHSQTFKKSGLTVGVFCYHDKTIGAHAINIFIFKKVDGEYRVGFYEPQTQNRVFLTEKEIKSCFNYSF